MYVHDISGEKIPLKRNFCLVIDIPVNFSEMKIKENNDIHNTYQLEICMLCDKKVIQVCYAVRKVIFIGCTGPVVKMSLYPILGNQQTTPVRRCRVFCTHMSGTFILSLCFTAHKTGNFMFDLHLL